MDWSYIASLLIIFTYDWMNSNWNILYQRIWLYNLGILEKKNQQSFLIYHFFSFLYWFLHCFCLFVRSILLLCLSRYNHHHLDLFNVIITDLKIWMRVFVSTWQINSKTLKAMYDFFYESILRVLLFAHRFHLCFNSLYAGFKLIKAFLLC